MRIDYAHKEACMARSRSRRSKAPFRRPTNLSLDSATDRRCQGARHQYLARLRRGAGASSCRANASAAGSRKIARRSRSGTSMSRSTACRWRTISPILMARFDVYRRGRRTDLLLDCQTDLLDVCRTRRLVVPLLPRRGYSANAFVASESRYSRSRAMRSGHGDASCCGRAGRTNSAGALRRLGDRADRRS